MCIPCIQERKITNDMLIEKAETVKAGRVVQEMLNAKAVLELLTSNTYTSKERHNHMKTGMKIIL